MSPNLIATILLVASAGAVFGFINPQYAKYEELSASKQQYVVAGEQARKVRQVREKLIQSINAISNAEKVKLTKLLPDSVDTVRLIMDINGIASKYRIFIKQISLKGDENTAGSKKDAVKDLFSAQQAIPLFNPNPLPYTPLPFSFSLTSTYNDFNQFLSDLEHSLRIIDITSISVLPSATANLYDFSVSAKTYSYKPIE